MNLTNQGYRLSDEPRSFGLSCTGKGLTLAGVPLLARAGQDFVPRPARQLHWLIDQAYQASSVTIWYEENPASEPVLTRVRPMFPFIWP